MGRIDILLTARFRIPEVVLLETTRVEEVELSYQEATVGEGGCLRS
jgi:hypothetical protein